MTVYTAAEMRRRMNVVLQKAKKEGSVRIRSRDGQTYLVTPEKQARSPLDIRGVPLGVTTEEIVSSIHEGRDSEFLRFLGARAAETDLVPLSRVSRGLGAQRKRQRG